MLTLDGKHRSSTAKATEARRQRSMPDIEPEPYSHHELTKDEKECMRGHIVYLKMLENGEVKSANAPSHLIRSTKKNRGTGSQRLEEAIAEFKKIGGSKYRFCKVNFLKYGYTSCLSMYSSLKSIPSIKPQTT